MSKAIELLNIGLLEGYARKSVVPRGTTRAGVEFKVINSRTGGGLYHDEWIAGRTGGGQELATVDHETWTRLYGGGVIPDTDLVKLGIDKQAVLRKLREFIIGSDGKTRLHEDYEASKQDWEYRYSILHRSERVGLTVGLETIGLKGEEVFAHGFLISPAG